MIGLKEETYRFVSAFFNYLGFYYVLKFINKKRIRILMYHGVDDRKTEFNSDDPILAISTGNFEKQIKYLKKSYNVISMYDMVSHMRRKIPFPPDTVVITFDDGLKNNYNNAFPILQKYNMEATVFLITGYIDTLKINWLNEFFYIIGKIDLSELVKEFKKEFPAYLKLIGKINQNNIIEYIKLVLIYRTDSGIREEFIQKLYDKFAVKIEREKIKNLYLSWKEIKEMAGGGISFGCHTSGHHALSVLEYKEAEEEIANCKRNIEAKLNKKVDLFAYPYGGRNSFNSDTKEILAKHGFSCAVSTIDGLNDLDSDLYELKRIPIADEPFYCFKMRIEGFEGFIKRIYRKLYRYFKKATF